MTAVVHEPYPPEDVLLEGFLALRTPEGFKAELIDGEIIVSPPPGGHHARAISRLIRQVMQRSSTDMDVSGDRGLVLPRGDRCPTDHAIPAVVFTPVELDLLAETDAYMSPHGVTLVVEVTSTRPDNDRDAKRHCYARGGIPLHVLVDRDRRTVTLFSEPSGDDYAESHSAAFGKPIQLPEPLSFELDTEDFT